MIKYLKELPEIVKTIIVLASLLGIGGGGMVWHHHKYNHGHDTPQQFQQSQKYKMSDDEVRLKIHQDMEEKSRKESK